MNTLDAWLDLVLEIVQREAYYTIYLVIVAAWFTYLGLRGVLAKETRGFGWRRGQVMDREAGFAGRVWLALGAALGGAVSLLKLI